MQSKLDCNFLEPNRVLQSSISMSNILANILKSNITLVLQELTQLDFKKKKKEPHSPERWPNPVGSRDSKFFSIQDKCRERCLWLGSFEQKSLMRPSYQDVHLLPVNANEILHAGRRLGWRSMSWSFCAARVAVCCQLLVHGSKLHQDFYIRPQFADNFHTSLISWKSFN